MNQQLAYLNQLKQMTELYQFMVKLCWLKAMLDAQSPTEDASPEACSKEKTASGAKKSAAEVHRGKSTCKSLSHQEKSEVSTMVASGCIKGRMYDFNSGRFLSVDPFIQGDSSQAINPYSYIQNNPLSGTDPTGYKSICGEEGKRKCDAIIGSHLGSQVWNGYANTNGKVVAVVVVIGEDGDTSDIYSINDRDQITKEGSDFLKGRSLKFASHTQRLMYMLAFENDRLYMTLFAQVNYCEGLNCISDALSRLSPITGSKLGDQVMSKWATQQVATYMEQNPLTQLAVCYPNCDVIDYIEAGLGVTPFIRFRGLGALRSRSIGAYGGSIRNINFLKGKTNCANCAIATDAMLAGHPASALNGGVTLVTHVEAFYGRTFSSLTTISRIEARMLNAGNGARGVVFGSRGVEAGHYFNVVNQKGTIRFLDGQSGTAANLKDDFVGFSLLRTN